MTKQQLEYVDEKYKPKSSELIAYYRLEPNGISFKEAAENVAAESSIGTWTSISTMKPSIAKRLKPHVYELNKKTKTIKIAYPLDLFEKNNMPQILSSVAGNVFGMKIAKNLRLLDIEFPKQLVDSFKGPAYGIEGIRKLTKNKSRPFLGTIVKPKVGLNEKEHANVAYKAWRGGLDIVKDDENLSSMTFNNFEDRITKTLELKDRAESETGEKKLYLANITAKMDKMIERAEYVKAHGGEIVMVDILTTGFSAIEYLRELDLGLILHAHRAGHAAVTKNKEHGITMLTIAKIARLLGMDTLHIGTANVGKMEGSKDEVLEIEDEIEEQFIKKGSHVLEQKWYNIKPTLAVASGGLYPGALPKLFDSMGLNIVAQAGGGCHGHPDGTEAGAKALRQITEAYVNKIPIKQAIEEHKELRRAIDKWGLKK